ncbi:hypothetical protein ACFLXQ_07270 [Chloroflexota bacterium]
MSLSWRLIISYIIIIVVSLSLAFLTLILIARPIQNRLIGIRLAAQSRRAALQINNLYRRGVSTERILTRLDSWASQNQTHLVIADQRGTVLADSQDAWVGQQLVIPPRDTDQASRFSAQSGTFDAPGGDKFMYATASIGSGDQRVGYVVFSAVWIAKGIRGGIFGRRVCGAAGVTFAGDTDCPIHCFASAAYRRGCRGSGRRGL